MYQRVLAEHVLDRAAQRLGAVDHEQDRLLGVHAELGPDVDGLEQFNTFSVPLFGFTYHLQDLTFFSWFARQTPSEGFAGRDTFLGYYVHRSLHPL